MEDQIIDIISEFKIVINDVRVIHSMHEKTHDLYIRMTSENGKISRIISGKTLSQARNIKFIVLEVLDDMYQDLVALQ